MFLVVAGVVARRTKLPEEPLVQQWFEVRTGQLMLDQRGQIHEQFVICVMPIILMEVVQRFGAVDE